MLGFLGLGVAVRWAGKMQGCALYRPRTAHKSNASTAHVYEHTATTGHKSLAGQVRTQRSPVTAPGYRRGMRPANKGLKLPAESLDVRDVNALLRAFGSSRIDVRNYAMVMLMYAVGLRIGEIVALERRHFDKGRHRLIVPATARLPERSVAIDVSTQEALERWIEVRRAAKIPAAAPLVLHDYRWSDGSSTSHVVHP